MPNKVIIIYPFFPLNFESLPFRGSDRLLLEPWSQARDRCPQAPRKGATIVWPQRSREYYVKRAKSTPGGEGSCVCFRLLTHGNCTGKNAKSLGSGDDFRLRCWQLQYFSGLQTQKSTKLIFFSKVHLYIAVTLKLDAWEPHISYSSTEVLHPILKYL